MGEARAHDAKAATPLPLSPGQLMFLIVPIIAMSGRSSLHSRALILSGA